METYTIYAGDCGWSDTFQAKSDLAAKLYATKQLRYGFGISLYKGDSKIGHREFWQNLSRFGWEKWEK